MGRNNTENGFRDKLNKREITPSQAGWDRLDAMLTVAEEKQTKSSYNWIYIAASIIGFLLIGYVFFANPKELIDVKKNEIVIDSNQPDLSTGSTHENNLNKLPIKSKNKALVESNEVDKKIPTSSKLKKTDNSLNANPIVQNATQSHPINASIINQKSEQINAINPNPVFSENQQVTNLEDVAKMAVQPIKVNASSLLSEVDSELTLSFREKVIKKIDKNFKTVRIALENRNQQTVINQ